MVPFLALALALAPVPEPNPDVLILFADDAGYRASPALEAPYEGPLEFLPGAAGPGRFRVLVAEGDGPPKAFDLHLPRPVNDLGTFVGQRVRLVAKATDKGLWPARIERLQVAGAQTRDGLFARSPWQPPAARRLQKSVQTFIIRSGAQAAGLYPVSGTGADTAATRLLAREFRVPEIDWNKQMAVCVAVGLRTDVERLTVTRAVVKDGAMTVAYRFEKPAGMAGGFGYPAETVLVPRFDGPVRFEEESAPAR